MRALQGHPAPIWDRPRPKKLGPSVPLTAAQKRKAKALAAAAGRSYPNLVDNIAATRNPMKTEILERAKLPNGTAVRLQKRGNAYDVITNSTGITWRYLEKGVSEQRARNAFDLYTMQRKENPMKQPTPAQIAARERFAEMARSGAFKRKAKRNPAKRSGYRITLLDDNNEPIDSTFDTTEQGALLYAKGKVLQGMKGEITYKFPKGERLAFYFDATGIYKAGSTTPFYTPYPARAMNPAKRKKTVSQKISQLMHEGYPQKQAVAVALSEQRAGKVKRNPAPKFSVGDEVKFAPAVVKRMGDARTKNMRGTIVEIMSAGKVALVDTHGTFVSEEGNSVRGIPTANLILDVKRNPATGHKGSRTKLNPMAAPARSASASNYKYSVEAKRLIPGGSVFEPLGGFQTKAQAQDYAKAILASHPSVTLRIKTYK